MSWSGIAGGSYMVGSFTGVFSALRPGARDPAPPTREALGWQHILPTPGARPVAVLLTILALTADAAQTNLPSLLVDEHGATVVSRTSWRQQRAAIRTQWLNFLGGFPRRRAPLSPEILATEQLPDFTRQFIEYEVEPGAFIDGYLLTPKSGKPKFPAVVVFHPTTPSQAKAVAGVDPDYPEDKRLGIQLVQRGYIAWCPRNYINTEGTNWAGNAALVLATHTNWTGMTRMAWDAIRAADFVESLPRVDRQRIGCIGHSLGGKEVLYAMAFDERYSVGVASEGGIGLRLSNWDAPWYLGPRIRQPGFPLEHHQLLALIAPRPFLLLAGDSADGELSAPFIEAARPVYKLLGAPEGLSFFNHHTGHRYPPEARARAEDFLDRRLKR